MSLWVAEIDHYFEGPMSGWDRVVRLLLATVEVNREGLLLLGLIGDFERRLFLQLTLGNLWKRQSLLWLRIGTENR